MWSSLGKKWVQVNPVVSAFNILSALYEQDQQWVIPRPWLLFLFLAGLSNLTDSAFLCATEKSRLILMWTNLHKSCECKPKGQLTWNWVNPIKYSKFLTMQIVFLCKVQLGKAKQRRGVLYANTHVRTWEIGRFSVIGIEDIYSVVPWPCIFAFFHLLKCALENVARKFPQILLVCVCVHLQNLTLLPCKDVGSWQI